MERHATTDSAPARPILLLMAGHPGAGKSTLALAIGCALGWPVLDKDTLKSTLLQSEPALPGSVQGAGAPAETCACVPEQGSEEKQVAGDPPR